MEFGDRVRARREELGVTRLQLAERLGVTVSAIGNYEKGISFPKEEILLRLFDNLETDPNSLFQDSFRRGGRVLTTSESSLLEQYRGLSPKGRETVRSVVDALCSYRDELEESREDTEPRVIPLYRSPAAAGYAAPVFGEDFDYIPMDGSVPQAAEFAVRFQGDSMTPYIADGSVVYVNRDPLRSGDVGIFCVDGDMLCKQYYKDPGGVVYLFSLNRARADADVVFTSGSGRTLVCFGRVILHTPPLPGKAGRRLLPGRIPEIFPPAIRFQGLYTLRLMFTKDLEIAEGLAAARPSAIKTTPPICRSPRDCTDLAGLFTVFKAYRGSSHVLRLGRVISRICQWPAKGFCLGRRYLGSVPRS